MEKLDLKYGDMVRIAEQTNYSYIYVKRVLSLGDRQNERIVRAAKELIKSRPSLKEFAKP